MDITQLPFNALIGITRSPEPGYIFQLPADPRYTNHLGTVHASALMALAEATSGQFLLTEYLLTEYPELEDGTTVPVVRKFEAKFRKPAIGAVSSTASALPDTRVAFKETFRRRGKATLYVAVDVSDEHGTHALSAMVGWFVTRVDK